VEKKGMAITDSLRESYKVGDTTTTRRRRRRRRRRKCCLPDQ